MQMPALVSWELSISGEQCDECATLDIGRVDLPSESGQSELILKASNKTSHCWAIACCAQLFCTPLQCVRSNHTALHFQWFVWGCSSCCKLGHVLRCCERRAQRMLTNSCQPSVACCASMRPLRAPIFFRLLFLSDRARMMLK